MGRRPLRILVAIGLGLLVLLVLGHAGMELYTDVLWYGETGYLGTYWTRFGWRIGVRLAAGAVGAAVVFLNLWWVARHLGPVRVRRRYGNIEIAEQVPRKHVTAISLAVAVLGGWWLAELQFGDAAVLRVASWLRRVEWGLGDPLFGHDVSFYVFTVPFLVDALAYLILVMLWAIALVSLGHVLVGGLGLEENRLTSTRPARLHLAALVAGLLVLLGVRYWLGRYMLVVDGTGVGGGLGYTDVEARLPAYWAMALFTLGAAASLVYGALRSRLLPPIIGLGGLLVAGVVVAVAYPALVQKFRVEPNELSREAPYIRWNMEFTRRAYGLDAMRRSPFPYRRGAAPAPARVEPILAGLPLWDPAPLERAYNEIQSLFRYYWFPDVDYDRYGGAAGQQQVAIGIREFQAGGLERGAQTWQSLRLNPSYIRGMGAVVAPAHPTPESEGAPELWVRNVNPVITVPEAPPELELTDPSVFFGETMTDYVIVVPGRDSAFTGTPGVAFPEGVPLSSFLRVLAFAWRFGDETLLFSGDVTRDSRLLYRRSVRERVEALAPFLYWDADPLPVIDEGRIVWLLDGYTTSNSYPLARAVTLGRQRVRYLRNSVKAAVDAVTGEVMLYRLGGEDPVLSTYERVYPRLFRPLSDMPAGLRRHLRYPELALLTQVEILQEYHLQRVETFYAGQDVWERPQDATAGAMQEYRPLYAMLPVPLENAVEYLALVPFIARGRQNMTAVLTARNDEARYGELTLLEFPRDQQIPGPGQVLAMMEQDPVISQELTLLRQRGSGVDMGQIRVAPLDSSVLYIQPLYLSAEENPIPELVRVVASDGRAVTMAETLAGALARLELPVSEPASRGAGAGEAEPTGWTGRALDLLERAEERLRAGDWAGYGRAMEELRGYLETLSREGVVGEGT